jgi:ribosomal 50S subunit-associated protein YjgA (DUF615 family)
LVDCVKCPCENQNAAASGIEMILQAMHDHVNNYKVHRIGYFAMVNLANNNLKKVTINRELLLSVELYGRFMNRHGGDKRIKES